MNIGEYFRIETEQELRRAYEMFKGEWEVAYSLEDEIKSFEKDKDFRYIIKYESGKCCLYFKPLGTEIPSPLKKKFVLPEKWYVVPETEENLEFIKDWAPKFREQGLRITYKDNTYSSDKRYYTHARHVTGLGYEQITMEQFKKYVLGMKTTEQQIEELQKQLDNLKRQYEEESNRNKLPKIGCREGEETERHIKYGDKNLSKKCLRQMQRAGIIYLVIEHNGEKFNVSPEELNKIYSASKS